MLYSHNVPQKQTLIHLTSNQMLLPPLLLSFVNANKAQAIQGSFGSQDLAIHHPF
ncbi:hypothetical protein Hanom_Chr02g00121731 [Helianthus anomalus]